MGLPQLLSKAFTPTGLAVLAASTILTGVAAYGVYSALKCCGFFRPNLSTDLFDKDWKTSVHNIKDTVNSSKWSLCCSRNKASKAKGG